ncbi:MAG: hypothetical protein Q4C04_03970 [Clostridia bacterium]|nr:hypothetical protein [Clostridia bacterium]
MENPYTMQDLMQNLQDAGCDRNTKERFLHILHEGNTSEQLRLLAKLRGELLNGVHLWERKIACLDHLIHNIEQGFVRCEQDGAAK